MPPFFAIPEANAIPCSSAIPTSINWHWVKPFHIEDGKSKITLQCENYADLTAEFLLNKMKKDEKIVTIVAGVPKNIGFDKKSISLVNSKFQFF